MITFASIFLGLVMGPQTIEVIVTEAVATVEVLIDRELVGRIEGEPWALDVDFGTSLVPHRLEAIARDRQGRELERALQWINLPQAPAVASFALALSPDGRGSTCRILWRSTTDEFPLSSSIWLDGASLPVADPSFFHLPDYEPNQLHFLRAELEFPENVLAVTEATFGGQYADEVSTELTAIPVSLRKRALPTVAELQPFFSVGGKPALVVAADKGPAEVVVVRDSGIRAVIAKIARETMYTRTRNYGGRVPVGRTFGLSLAEGQWLRIFGTIPQVRQQSESRFLLFPSSPDYSPEEGLFFNYLVNTPWQDHDRSKQRLVDAVAVAGVSAAERNRRRAVVVILAEPFQDRSQLLPAQVRQYLSALRVPLYVWSTQPEAWRALEDRGGWGEIISVRSLGKLTSATIALRRALESQRIVWLDGVHLPNEVTMTDSKTLRVVGQDT